MHHHKTRHTPLIRFLPIGLGALLAGLVSAGCRHGNAINFVTNTQFGIKVGVNAEKIPEAQIGYNRQEAARVPVYHEVPSGVTPTGPNAEGKFTAKSKEGARDAYSVIGTFSGDASGGTSGSGTGMQPQVNTRIGQYFATGVAAQLLAQTGGAALVNPGVTHNATELTPEREAELKNTAINNLEEAQAIAEHVFKKAPPAAGGDAVEPNEEARKNALKTLAGDLTQGEANSLAKPTDKKILVRLLRDFRSRNKMFKALPLP